MNANEWELFHIFSSKYGAFNAYGGARWSAIPQLKLTWRYLLLNE